MATRTFQSTKGDTWEWEETPEVIEAISEYWKVVENNRNNEQTV